ncbi:MAG: 5-formyltetrahydrofolate cyclo-ligase [Christensenellaceae bacterium]|jgi:5-formyltetrahydrofolate cyclo-ligase|nr:5-formyltetrahydrofolate cyclo-ligase [Christensenellaceae bacterium]
MTQDEIARQKATLRKEVRQRLASLSQAEIARQSALACERVCALIAYQCADTILAYKALPRECDPAGIVEHARLRGKRVAFPLCGPGNTLRLYLPLGGEGAFVRGKYGIWEPNPANCQEISPLELNLVLTPLVAFDAACARLGQGGGYYDRLLRQTTAQRVGLALEEQRVESIPVDAYDVPLQAVVTASACFARGDILK